MEFVLYDDFDDCNGDNLQNRCSIVSGDESEWCFLVRETAWK
jgi:hypothetical protein